ncbi:MAG TPA: HD domain-containing protein [Anaerolineales bacterium]|nr:HD domain-containing protein [Anaerolineae bacterium]HIQ01217.1 HD domain-containing protein [Anaerolineales bacterium]
MLGIEEARRYYRGAESGHDFDHVLRVLVLAERIARAEGGDLEVVRAAALLHDLGRPEERITGQDHAEVGAERAREILAGRPPEKVEAVVHAIAAHRFRAGPDPATPEARALFDADKLDAMGAIGVARAFAHAGARGQRLWVPLEVARAQGAGTPEHTPVHEFAFKLSCLREVLTTPTGRAIARERHAFMEAFFARLEAEVRGER